MLTMAAALGIDRFIYTPILPIMAEAERLSATEAGLIASANFLGYLVGALVAAISRLSGSRRGWLVGMLALSALSTGVTGLASSLPSFLLVRFAGGAAGAVAIVIAISLVVDAVGATGRNSLIALHFGGVGVGIATSAAVLSGLVLGGAGWRSLWMAAGSISVLLSALVALLTATEPAGKQALVSRNYKLLPGFKSLLVANALASFGYVMTATFLVAMVRHQPELRPLEAWIWIVFGLATAPSVAAWIWIASRKGIPRALALAYLVEATGVALSVLWPTQQGMLIAAVFVGATFIANTALGMMLARALCSGDLRKPVALMTAAFGVGQIAGPAFAGALHDALGSFLFPSLIAATGVLIGAALVGRLDLTRP